MISGAIPVSPAAHTVSSPLQQLKRKLQTARGDSYDVSKVTAARSQTRLSLRTHIRDSDRIELECSFS